MRLDRRALLLGALAAAGCAPARPTGDRLPPVEGGIGGTGIVGVVTSLGSVRIAGLRVGIEGARVEDAFGPRDAASLGPGHSLTIEATGAEGDLAATRVRLTPPLIGRVASIDRATGRLRVLGVEVTLEPGLDASVEVGDRVAVSGLWRGDAVVASRLDRLAPEGPSAASGALRLGAGRPAVNGVPLLSGLTATAGEGDFVTVIGDEHEAGLAPGLAPRRVASGRFAGDGGAIRRLRVEGYLERALGDPGVVVSGFGHGFDPLARPAALAGIRALFIGRFDGLFAVDHGVPLPESAAARARLLEARSLDLIPTR